MSGLPQRLECMAGELIAPAREALSRGESRRAATRPYKTDNKQEVAVRGRACPPLRLPLKKALEREELRASSLHNHHLIGVGVHHVSSRLPTSNQCASICVG